MAVSESFKDYVLDLLKGFGPVTIRNMFGGAGVYADGVMFAILTDDALYLKADASSSQAFATEGMRSFTYSAPGRAPVAMSYWQAPERLLEEPDELAIWAREAHRIARANKTKDHRATKIKDNKAASKA
jgi:DNA transformation protein